MPSPGCTPLLRSDPRSIGRYRIIGRLGVGGMATVYLGDADGYVAVKLVHEHLAADAEFRARFERETQLAARVPAHCTAALLDSGVHDDRPYLVTEYLAGSPLHRLVEDEGPLDAATLHNVAVGLAAGLTTIHDHDLVHRDLKPSNVMVTRGGVRIIDFGIARTLDTTTNFTRSGFVMGSLGWTSPEQLEGRSPMPAMDVFAWGCVLAYAATGRHPFGGDDSVSRSWQILNGEPDLDGVPGSLVELIAAALDRNTESRPTAQELLLGLVGAAGPAIRVPAPKGKAAAGGKAAAPAVASVDGSIKRPPRRRRWALLLGAVPVGLAVVLSVSSAAGGGGDLVPAESSSGSSSGSPTAPAVPGTSPGTSPGTTDRPANQPGDATAPTQTTAPTTTGGVSNPVGGGGGQSPPATEEDGKPKKSKKPKD